MDPRDVRDIWHLLETVHAVTYFAPGCREAHADLGFKGFWMGYFGTRAAPMGAVGAGVVTAAFAGFHPDMVQRAVPDAWELCAPAAAVDGRSAAAADMLRSAMHGVGELAVSVQGVLDRAVESADPTGRPLFAANAEVDPYEDPVADMWQMCTTLREHRGDGHVAVLVAEGLSGCEPHVLASAAKRIDPALLLAARGWSEQEWAEAATTLTAAGLLADGALTERGRTFHDHVESRTDDLAGPPFAALGEDGRDRLRDALIPLVAAVLDAGWISFPNPIGLPEVA